MLDDDRDRRAASARTTKPRYLMGVGTPDDLLESLARGVDMFDCVMPTRAGRHGLVFTRHGRMNLRNARYADDPRPIDERLDLRRRRATFRAPIGAISSKPAKSSRMMALTAINIAYYQDLMAGARAAIARGGSPITLRKSQRRLGSVAKAKAPRKLGAQRRKKARPGIVPGLALFHLSLHG